MYIAIAVFLFSIRFLAGAEGKANALAYRVLLVGLFLFCAFRFRVGCDWDGYYYNYVRGDNINFQEALAEREPLWWMIQIFLRNWSLSYPIDHIITSVIFFTGINAFAQRQRDPLGFLVLLFPVLIMNIPMSAIRQAAALGFLCLSYCAFIDRKPAKYAAWILVGATIHSSVSIFLILVPFATGRLTRGRIAAAFLIAVPAAFVFSRSDAAQVAIDRYVDTETDAFGAIYRSALLTLSAIYFQLVAGRRWQEKYPGDYGLMRIASWIMILVTPLTVFSSVISDRLGYYVVPLQTAMFARIPFLGITSSSRRIFEVLPYIGLLIFFVTWTFTSSLYLKCYVPYQTWLFGNDQFGIDGF